MQRPNKLKVISPGDGPRTEFYYDGKTVNAYEPAAKLAWRTVDAPDTIDAMLRARVPAGGDLLSLHRPRRQRSDEGDQRRTCASPSSSASRPWWAASRTDIVVLVGKFAHVQLWIGSDDKLPRMARAIFLEDPARYRHTVMFSDWKIDPPLARRRLRLHGAGRHDPHTVRAAGRHGKEQVRVQESTMNRKLFLLAAIAIATPLAPAAAWFHAGGWSGDRSSWSAHTWRGGTASGGDGSW